MRKQKDFPKKSCINCHYLLSTRSPAHNVPATEHERDLMIAGKWNELLNGMGHKCHYNKWLKNPGENIKINRAKVCTFFSKVDYRMTFEEKKAAKEKRRFLINLLVVVVMGIVGISVAIVIALVQAQANLPAPP